MAKVQTAANGRRYVEIDGVIERRLNELKKSQNGNGVHPHQGTPSTPEDRSQSPKTVKQENARGSSAPA